MTFKTEREIMKIADHIEALAFKMVAPNAYTPMFVSLANEIRTAIHTRLAQPDPRNQCGETCERAKLCAVCLAEMGAQPEREWQALTDREVGALTVFDGLHHVEVPVLAKFVWAVEAKLKEKNT